MIARVMSAALRGIDAHIVYVEVDVSRGLPAFDIVGLPDAGARESKERVRAAIRNCGWEFPLARITVNLAPGRWRKVGPGFDLPIAFGILQAAGYLPAPAEPTVVAGELALDGSLRTIAGGFCIADAARRAGIRRVLLPREGAGSAALVPGVRVIGSDTLRQAVDQWSRTDAPVIVPSPRAWVSSTGAAPDLAEVQGQALARRALEIAAAGSHNLLMIGPPGSGKTFLARCLPSLLPDLEGSAALEVTRIYSAVGKLRGDGIVRRPPWRAPHHSVTTAGLIGGGSQLHPGEVTLAHRGVLFLDELPEFRPAALEALRQPLEEGLVTLVRSPDSRVYPARFLLVAAANPCPCGYLGDAYEECRCRGPQLARYRARLSGPLADRIDIHLRVERLRPAELAAIAETRPLASGAESSEDVRGRVAAARERQLARAEQGETLNGHLSRRQLALVCRLDDDARAILQTGARTLKLSARGVDRVLKVSRTIADLAGSARIRKEHVMEALQYRRPVWLTNDGNS